MNTHHFASKTKHIAAIVYRAVYDRIFDIPADKLWLMVCTLFTLALGFLKLSILIFAKVVQFMSGNDRDQDTGNFLDNGDSSIFGGDKMYENIAKVQEDDKAAGFNASMTK